MHRRGARTGNQDATICKDRTPRAKSRAFWGYLTGPPPPAPKTSTRSVRVAPRRGRGAGRNQAGTRRCGSGPAHRPRPPGPAHVPFWPETRPVWASRRRVGRSTSLPAQPRRPATAQRAARRKEKGVSERVHSAARRRAPTSPRPLRAPVPGRTHLRRAAAAAAATAASRRRPSPSPSPWPAHAGAAARGLLAGAGGLGGGVRRSAWPPHARPGRGGRGGHGGHCGRRASGRGLRLLHDAARRARVAGLRRGGRGLRRRSGQGRGGAVRGAGQGRAGRGQGAGGVRGVRAGLGVPAAGAWWGSRRARRGNLCGTRDAGRARYE